MMETTPLKDECFVNLKRFASKTLDKPTAAFVRGLEIERAEAWNCLARITYDPNRKYELLQACIACWNILSDRLRHHIIQTGYMIISAEEEVSNADAT